jgi:hypothetical protein
MGQLTFSQTHEGGTSQYIENYKNREAHTVWNVHKERLIRTLKEGV